jgi:hypothetical protein
MTFEIWLQLSPQEQREQCQKLNPYEDRRFFKQMEAAFIEDHGEQPGIAEVFCGIAGGLGPLNAIVVHIQRGKPRVKAPKCFL